MTTGAQRGKQEGTGYFGARRAPLRPVPMSPEDAQRAEAEYLLRRFNSLVLKEFRTTFLSRLLTLHLLFATVSFAEFVSRPGIEKKAGIVWLALIVVSGMSMWLIARAGSRRAMHLMAAVGGVWALGWMIPIVGFTTSEPVQLVLGLLMWGVGVFGLPWSLGAGFGLAVILFAAALAIFQLQIVHVPSPLAQGLWLAVIVGIALGGVRFALEMRLQLLTRIAQQLLGEYCASVSSSALASIRLLAAEAKIIVGVPRALIITAGGVDERIEGSQIKSSAVDPVFAKGIALQVADTRREYGVLKTKQLDDQYRAPMHDWFGRIPGACFFLSFLMVLDEKEQQVVLLLPIPLVARLAGLPRILKALHGLQAMAQVSLAAARSRFLASDSLLVSQRSALEREGEVNELVHLVNNVAQDIAMQCEQIHASVTQRLSAPELATVRAELTQELRELEVMSRNLSAGVSDTKLLNELLRIRSFSRTDIVAVGPMLEDLKSFAAYRAKRRGSHCAIEAEIGPAVAVKVTSREFLETCLRALLKESFGVERHDAEIRLFCRANDDAVVFEILGFCEPDKHSELVGGIDRTAESWEGFPAALGAVRRFAELSSGAFEVRPAEGVYRTRFVLSLPRGTLALPKRSARGRWALFVDDNPQVTAFYGRVAEAFSLPFFSAASVTEAIQIIDREGQPRLAISDLQLGEESGLDLVRTLRQRFGKELPVIVVSGNVAEDVRVQVQQAGASNFLAKPVGRARLVAEMQTFLGGS